MRIITKMSLSLLSLIFFNPIHSLPYEMSYQNNRSYSDHSPSYDNYYDHQSYSNNYNPGHPTEEYPYANSRQKYYDGDAPQPFDWSYHEAWRDNRKAYYAGETQPQAFRKSHPHGEKGIGYDADPTYVQMKNEYNRLRSETNQLAENNRIASREPHEPQEFYSRGGGGSSQKGRASREAREQMQNR